jgi:hypothetical protein
MTQEIRRQDYKGFDIVVTANTNMSAMGDFEASFLVHRQGKPLHSGTLAEAFQTFEDAIESAFERARDWIDKTLPA